MKIKKRIKNTIFTIDITIYAWYIVQGRERSAPWEIGCVVGLFYDEMEEVHYG